MSAPFRNQIRLLAEEADDILNNQKSFALPVQTGSISQYHTQIRTLINSLDTESQNATEIYNDINRQNDLWMGVRTSMTGAERIADNPIYDEFVQDVPYPTTIRNLKKYINKLRTEKATLSENLPDPSKSTDTLFHLPKLSLPKFSGKCIEFTSFWNSFRVGVHDIPNLSDAVKFNYLKECLDGPALLLIKSLPLTDASYHEAIRLLRENYGNANEINKTLLHSIRKLPIVHSNNGPETFCMELRAFVDQFELLYLQMLEQEFDINTLSVQMELESKLPPLILEEIFKAKDEYGDEWQTDQLRTTLKQILKRKEGIKSLKDQKKELNIPEATRFSPRSPRNNWTNESSPPHTPNSSLTFSTTRNNMPMPRSRFPCVFCNQFSHFSNACTQYPNLQTRTSRLCEKGLCFKCLKNNHQSINCPRPIKCTFCQNNHPRAICRALFNSPQNNTNTLNNSRYNTNNSNRTNPHFPYQTNYSQPQPAQIPSLFANTSSQNFNEFPAHQNHSKYKNEQQLPSPNPETKPIGPAQINTSSRYVYPRNPNSSPPILLKCIRVEFFNPTYPSKRSTGFLMLDDASTHSYIQKSEAISLGLKMKPTTVNLGVFSNPSCQTTTTFSTEFGLKLIDGRSIYINACTINHLTQPTKYIPPFFETINSTSEFLPPAEIIYPVILLGSDYYYDLEPTPIKKLPSGYTLVSTLLGPIVAGKPYSPSNSIIHTTNFCSQIDDQIQQFLSLEGIGIKEDPGENSEDKVSTQFVKDIKFVDGRYEIKFPFKTDPAHLPIPTNFPLCYGRLRSVLNSLKNDKTLISKYQEILTEQLQLGIIEKVQNPNQNCVPLHYLPHHPVIRQDKKTVRIVYDGSAKLGKNLSLNECLFSGPNLLNDLVGLLFKFRFPKYIITADIQKAFLQISINPSDRDVTRFLWLQDISLPLSSSNIQIYRFARVPFGLICSPFLLAATIRYHLSKNKSLLSQELEENIYVDNILLTASSITEGKLKCLEATKLFAKANMKLREFVSNCQDIIQDVPEEDRLPSSKIKFLGIKYCPIEDKFRLNLPNPPEISNPKKCDILSFVASSYDPCGFFSPILLPLKLFFQSLWLNNLKWTDPIPEEKLNEWTQLFVEWKELNFSIPRCISPDPLNVKQIELHCFSDASSQAMCAAIYLRIHLAQSIHSTLLFSKTKLKPITKKGQKLTIPKMELIAALVGMRALNYVKSQLPPSHLDENLTLWVDSSVVIGWLNSRLPIKDIFIYNRIKPIRATPNLKVRHIVGSQNPSDLGTRGVTKPSELFKNDLWLYGPPWLSSATNFWPKENAEIPTFSSNDYKPVLETTETQPIMTFHTTQTKPTPLIEINKFSRLPKLLRVTVYVLRFIAYNGHSSMSPFLRKYPRIKNSNISIRELRSALKILIKQEQDYYPPSEQEENSLGLFNDENNLIRANGRLGNSNLPQNTIMPLFLPANSHLTKLLIYEIHVLNHHASPLSVLSMIRREFWIPRGRRVVQHTLYLSCLPCRRFNSVPFNRPPLPQLPEGRVTPSRPFSAIGLDYCGPLRLKYADINNQKFYILLWVCLTTRGICLDLVPNQSAQQFSLAYRRFSAKFSPPTVIYSDSAPTFVSFKNSLKTYPPTWNLRVPYAAWRGGHYERFVGLIKFHLRRTLSTGIIPKIFSFEEALTIIGEIENIINHRPITFDSTDPNEIRPLRPIDFIRPLNKNISPISNLCPQPHPLEINSNTISLQKLWKTLTKTSQKFWKQWAQEYILSLRERHKI
uniref:Integrase catalytic domain-containing protein n=1 Tax=Meloidogyne enterolobii TaxID=390850 RepID=A0A6V7TUX5_MELEN|nr:unnamed protein product [Meloidogyne enterolobii]